MATCRECFHEFVCEKKNKRKMYNVYGKLVKLSKIPNIEDYCPDCMLKSDYVKRERGEWIFDEDNDFYCSACKKYPPLMKHTDFCPNCGSDMRKEDNNA